VGGLHRPGRCGGVMPAYFTKRYILSAVHRHHNPDLSEAENQELYRKCSAVHGHEYKVEVTLKTALPHMDRKKVDEIVREKIIRPMTGQYLNEIVGNTSGEIIVQKFFDILKPSFAEGELVRVTLRETRKNSFSRSFTLAETNHVAI
jgi:6-pyruvoyltetrahydropterin/6-carboxytetrahydropterin synthase